MLLELNSLLVVRKLKYLRVSLLSVVGSERRLFVEEMVEEGEEIADERVVCRESDEEDDEDRDMDVCRLVAADLLVVSFRLAYLSFEQVDLSSAASAYFLVPISELKLIGELRAVAADEEKTPHW